jgi:P-type E1-E2 ATPase
VCVSECATLTMELNRQQAKTATLLTTNSEGERVLEQVIDVELLQRKDWIKVIPGERIASDGKVVFGRSMIDESMITGESMPVAKSVGDLVIGGTINQTGMLHVEVTKGNHMPRCGALNGSCALLTDCTVVVMMMHTP